MDGFQNAKDTFYTTLRDRLAVLNPDRTTLVRGATRTALLVEENELAAGTETDPLQTFVLRWTERGGDPAEQMVLQHGRCEVRYAVAGSMEVAGMDRGRMMDAMDAELFTILRPGFAVKLAFDSGAAVPLLSNVFWSDAALQPAKVAADRLVRTVLVDVFAWKETA